jgi:hypothetical protein
LLFVNKKRRQHLRNGIPTTKSAPHKDVNALHVPDFLLFCVKKIRFFA